MKNGRDINNLITEIERQAQTKRDFLAPTPQVSMVLTGNLEDLVDIPGSGDLFRRHDQARAAQAMLEFRTGDRAEQFPVTDYASSQLGTWAGIPRAYYQTMAAQAPGLLAVNVNHWLQASKDKRLVRTLDGRVRAWLSSKYRALDNYDLAEAVFPVLSQLDCEPGSAEITDTRLYIKALRPELTAEIKGSRQVGDIVQAGVVVSNSEVGAGSVSVQPLIYRLVCKNGMISADHSIRKYHVGTRNKNGGDVPFEVMTDRTRAATDRAFWLQIQDLVRSALDGSVFRDQVRKIEEAAGDVITGEIEPVIETVVKTFGIQERERGGILKSFINGADLSRWGLCNAVTEYSQTVEDYDRATELERVGGQIVELDRKSWDRINKAA